MALITWQDEYALGIEEIDSQHKKIVDIINRLFQMFTDKDTRDETKINGIFQELVDYANYHFSTEEKYFELFSYPGTSAHLELHEKYRAKVEELKKQYETDKGEAVFFALTNFLQDWWVWHINNADRAYAPLFKEKGVK